jgi:Ser/Thr protein kinase RdoA (MazF antagonist)
LRASDSEPLAGGNTHAAIVRVGDTVRRPAGAWTPAVHALLAHLARAGFEAAPRALGLDGDGCEVVSFAPGDVVWPGHFDLLEHDEALAEVGRLIRRYHDVVATFVPPPGAVWWALAADPSGVHELVCHNDLAPWNLVRGADGGWTFIDWDLAAPGRRVWDLGWELLAFIPLTPDRPLDDAAIARRLRVFMAAYGSEEELEPALAAAIERAGHEAASKATKHPEIWAGAAERVSANAAEWARRSRRVRLSRT